MAPPPPPPPPSSSPIVRASASESAMPPEILDAILKAFVGTPSSPLCRIEAVRALLRLRLVCRRWRDAVQSDAVARHAFGRCEVLGERHPTSALRGGKAQRKYVSDVTDDADPVAAWHSLVDPEAVGYVWEFIEEEIDDDDDPMMPLVGKNIYRDPAVRHWRCGRVTAGSGVGGGGGGDEVTVRVVQDGRATVLLQHDGDCVPAGGWFALLVDATVVAWCRAKMSRSLLDDGFGGYYSKATMPFMFSNQCETVLDRLREAHSKVVDRQVFDLATGGAYDPKYPFRLEELNGLHSHFFSRYADSHSHLQPELADCYVPASKLCPGDCSFCSDAFADSYFDWRGQTAVTIRNMGKTSSHLGSQRIAKAYDGKWLMRTLSRHCAGFLSSKAAGNTPILYGISEQSELDDFPHHVYGITVGLKTGRLMGFFSWYRTGCGP